MLVRGKNLLDFLIDGCRRSMRFLPLALLILSGCISENPDLVNPAPVMNTVTVRFLNFAGDGNARSLSLSKTEMIPETPWGAISPSKVPPADTGWLGTSLNGNSEYTAIGKTKFTRSTHYTFVALPSPKGSAVYRKVDTVVALTQIPGEVIYEKKAYLSAFNAVNDTTATYSITVGCPNGSSVASNLAYRAVSSATYFSADSMSVTLIKNQGGASTQVNLYKFKLDSARQYVLIIAPSAGSGERLMLLDHDSLSVSGLMNLDYSTERVTFIRTFNFTDQVISVAKQGDIVTSGLNARYIDNYSKPKACLSASVDTIIPLINGNAIDTASALLQVDKKYSYFVYPAPTTTGYKSVLVNPVEKPATGYASIKVVNINHAQANFTISLGARNIGSSGDWETGTVLAADTAHDTDFPVVQVLPGHLPITVFTKTQPAHLITCSDTVVEADKRYLLIYAHIDGLDRLYLSEENDGFGPLTALDICTFAQYINTYPSKLGCTVSIGNFQSVVLPYLTTLATVVKPGTVTSVINGTTLTHDIPGGKSVLMISAGTQSAPEMFYDINLPRPADAGNVYRRIFNASAEVQSIDVRDGCLTCDLITQGITYASFSSTDHDIRDFKKSYFFLDAGTSKLRAHSGDVTMITGKSYTVIFGGSTTAGFNFVIAEDF